MPTTPAPVVVGCGALARELRVVLDQLQLHDVDTRYVPANLHNHPQQIPAAVERELAELHDETPVLVAYADCGTAGHLDSVLERYPSATRLPGAHCYEFFAGSAAFDALAAQELGTFYLTDYLALHFDALVWDGLGLRDHPELRDMYFGHYRRLVWLAQTDDPTTDAAARAAAQRLGLEFHRHDTGLEQMAAAIDRTVAVALTPPDINGREVSS